MILSELGWYSSEYIVGSKSIGNFELTAGLGFGRLSGKCFFKPIRSLLQILNNRQDIKEGAEHLVTINWFRGDAAAFYGLQYQIGQKISILENFTRPYVMEKTIISYLI